MSLAIKFGEIASPSSLSGFIYFDAVTNYGKQFSGRVTSHPVESGVNISDHFRSDNPKIQISGVISGVDISAIPSQIFYEQEPVLNANAQPEAVVINNLREGLSRFIPDSINQFLPNTPTDVIVSMEARTDFKEEIELLLESIMNGVYYNEQRKKWENRMTLITLYECEGSFLGRSRPNLVMTDYRVSETAETGDGLYLEITLEQVRFATLEKAEAPVAQKGSNTDKAASSTKNKGGVTATTADAPKKTDRVFSTTTSRDIGGIVQ